jgi:ABC-2 type transport system ATP-binding protein
MSVPILEVVNLSKRYGSTVALDGVSFAVQKGEIFGLLGPNGAGKTTLLSIASGLLDASGGKASMHGRDALPLDAEQRRQVGIVPQELAVYSELTGRENLMFFGRLYGANGTALADRVEEVLTAIGLADRAEAKVATFSGGMKRRLNLGAALVHRPALLFLDEPTTGVDPQSRNHVFEEIRRVNRAGATIVYTSHYMEEVEALCSRVGIIDRGRLIACDAVPGLLGLMSGSVRFRVSAIDPRLLERLDALPGVVWTQTDGNTLELECHDVKGTLLKLISILSEQNLELIKLETEEPNLEGVFLHLTGRGLRD